MGFRHAVALVLAVGAILGAGLAQAAEAPSDGTKPGDAKAGQAKAATCGACHGLDGNPSMTQYPKLAGQNEEYIARQVELIKSGKRINAVMMGFIANLSAQDMRDIGAFYESKTSLPGVAEGDAKVVDRGQTLYRAGDAKAGIPACTVCHGPTGRGNPGQVYPQVGAQYGSYLAAKLKDFRDGKGFSDDDHAKLMLSQAKNLSDADIAALSSYIEGLHAASNEVPVAN